MSGEYIIKKIARYIVPKNRGKLSIGVLVSGGGSNLQALIDFSKTLESYFSVNLVIANNPSSFALTRAKNYAIQHHLVDHRTFFDKKIFEQTLIDRVQ